MRKEALNLTDEIKKEIKSRLLKKDINKEEVYQQFYQEIADFVMKEFQLTLDEAYSYINMSQSYYKTIEIKIAEIIIETNLSKDGR